MKPYVIGIMGGSASGKTSIVKEIKKACGEKCTILYFDDYYKDLTNLTYEQRSKVNFDHPDAFDLDILIENIKDLKEGKEITKPVYDFTVHNRSNQTETLKPTPIIIIDGLFTLTIDQINEQLDLRLFVDTPADIRFIRRLERDMLERKRTLESVKTQYLQTVRPMHEKFIEPYKVRADLIITNGVENVNAIDVILAKISSKLQ